MNSSRNLSRHRTKEEIDALSFWQKARYFLAPQAEDESLYLKRINEQRELLWEAALRGLFGRPHAEWEVELILEDLEGSEEWQTRDR